MKNKKGFTLVELILYVGITTVMLLVVSVFLGTLLQSRVKNQTIAEVEQQGLQVMQMITQTIRNARGINSPTQGGEADVLSVNVFTIANDPTVFDLTNGIVRITEGTGSAVPLTNSRLIVSGLTFSNFSYDDTAGIVRVQFTLTHINPESRSEYDFNKTFIASASLRDGIQAASVTQADALTIDTSEANIGKDKELRGITIENTGGSNIILDKIALTWTNDQRIEEIEIEGIRVWKHNNEGSPDGKQSSGTELDIVDYTIIDGSIHTFDKFKFDDDIDGDTFTIIFEMGDGSTKSTGSFSP